MSRKGTALSVKRSSSLFLLIVFFTAISPAAPQYQVLYSFAGGTDGVGLYSGVVFDKKGNLYGTTFHGGDYQNGTVFRLKPRPTRPWSERILHSFNNDTDGQQPNSTLVIDAGGNLYGAASLGGPNHAGTAFQMAPGPSGWAFNVIYNFCSLPDCADGGASNGGFVLDHAGNLYGILTTVLELSPNAGTWTPNLLYTFCSKPGCADGNGSFAPLTLDSKGNLYGTTPGGGAHQNAGTVFKVRRMPDGSWKERVLHSFRWSQDDGAVPGWGQLIFDSSGNLYGTTARGGSHNCGEENCGTIFRLTRQPDGHWKATILYNFDSGAGGNTPESGVAIDDAGSLYGTTLAGGTGCDCGVIYKLTPNPDHTWTYTALHSFVGSDGAFPHANMIFDKQGNLYGTTLAGGPGGFGVVFELTP